MTANKVWNMFVCCASAGKDKSFETKSSQYSTMEQGEWRRNSSTLIFNEEMCDQDFKKIVLMTLIEALLR